MKQEKDYDSYRDAVKGILDCGHTMLGTPFNIYVMMELCTYYAYVCAPDAKTAESLINDAIKDGLQNYIQIKESEDVDN